jgi:hypothetical protein
MIGLSRAASAGDMGGHYTMFKLGGEDAPPQLAPPALLRHHPLRLRT